ncbi:hypothetical protein ACFLTL_00175, partial [Chloroflexota bacterium]
QYDSKRQEVDETIMIKQGVLEGGPLMGLLSIFKLTEVVLAPLKEERRGDSGYEALGKKVRDLIYPPVSRFINILRINYGQYWIKELEDWDSRERSLGNYCQFILHLQWSLDDGQTWKPFIPNQPIGYTKTVIIYSKKKYMNYISRDDWQCLTDYFIGGYLPSPGAYILFRTHQFMDKGNLKYAFIEGVTAFELAISEFIRDKLGDYDALNTPLNSFFNLPLLSQLAVVSVTLGLDTQDIEKAIKAIKTRNKIVHEGYIPPSSSKEILEKLMSVTARLISGPNMRFPTANPGNTIMPVEQWDSID